LKINPEVFTTPDRPIIRIREFRGHVDLDDLISKLIHAQGWGSGTYFSVQFMNHERSKIFASGEFMVTMADEALVTSNPDSRNPNTKMVSHLKSEMVGEWFVTSFIDERDPARKQDVKKLDAEVKWNPGVKRHQVIVDNEVVFESEDKSDIDDYLKKAA